MSKTKDPKNWYAVYTKPRWEKKVHEQLVQRGVETYCPTNKVRKKWSDRYKIVEEPLFKSYVFVRLATLDLPEVRFVSGIVNYVYWQGKPAVINPADIRKIKLFLNEHTDVHVMPMETLSPGSKVRIISGVFMDYKARVVQDRNKSVTLEIQSLGCLLVAAFPKDQLEAIS